MEFTYSARLKGGQIQRGTIEARDKKGAVAALQDKDLMVLEIVEKSSSGLNMEIGLFNRVKNKEMVSFSRQLSTLFSARIPLIESLRVLGRQSENKYFTRIIFEVASDIEGGSLLSRALAKHPKVFSQFFINMVRSGEVSGGLDKALNYLADYLEKQYYLSSKIRGAMAYPAFILSGFVVIGILMMTLVVPKLMDFLKESNTALPLPTVILLAVSTFFQSWWWAVSIVLVGGVTAVYLSIQHLPKARYIFDTIKIKAPILKGIFTGLYLARFTDNLSTLIQGGLPILQALQVAGDVIGNVVYRGFIMEARENVRVGNTISSCFYNHPEIPPMVTQMIATGEQTGSLDDILKKLSAFYTKEVDAMVDSLSTLIEPALILVLGGAVAVLVSAILLPIYNIAGSM